MNLHGTASLGGDLSTYFAARLLTCILMAGIALPSFAQQGTPPSADPTSQGQPAPAPQQPNSGAPPQGPDKSQPPTSGHSDSSGTSKDRLFYALPNFLTIENSGRISPLTAKQKFGVVARGSFDYVQFPWYAFLSGISQAEDSEPGFGQGWEGYGKRFGAAFADGTIENFMAGAILPSLLHQDPRYFQSGHGSFAHRTLYAMSRNLITRNDSGDHQFNYSEVVGGAMAASISTFSYHPRSHLFSTTTPGVYRYVPTDRTLANAAKVWGTQYGYDTLTLVVKEFWPDIRRKLSHKPKAE